MEQIRNVFYVTPKEVTPELLKRVIMYQEDPEISEAYGDVNCVASKYNILAISDDGIDNEKDKVFLDGFCDVRTYGLWRYCGCDFRVTYFNPYRGETVRDAAEILRCIANYAYLTYKSCRYAGEVIAHIINSDTRQLSFYHIEDTEKKHKISIGIALTDHLDKDLRCIIREDNNHSPVARLIQGSPLYLYSTAYGEDTAREINNRIWLDEKESRIYNRLKGE